VFYELPIFYIYMESPTSMTSTAETTKNTPIHFVLNVQPTLKFWRLSEGCFKEFQGYSA